MCVEEQTTKRNKHLEDFPAKTVHRFQFYSRGKDPNCVCLCISLLLDIIKLIFTKTTTTTTTIIIVTESTCCQEALTWNPRVEKKKSQNNNWNTEQIKSHRGVSETSVMGAPCLVTDRVIYACCHGGNMAGRFWWYILTLCQFSFVGALDGFATHFYSILWNYDFNETRGDRFTSSCYK